MFHIDPPSAEATGTASVAAETGVAMLGKYKDDKLAGAPGAGMNEQLRTQRT